MQMTCERARGIMRTVLKSSGEIYTMHQKKNKIKAKRKYSKLYL